VVKHRVSPRLGDLREEYRLSGPAIVDFFIDAAGSVCAVRVEHSIHPQIDEQIIRAASEWTFVPARMHGKPVACVLPVRVIIDLR
jgi:TonB family protein